MSNNQADNFFKKEMHHEKIHRFSNGNFGDV